MQREITVHRARAADDETRLVLLVTELERLQALVDSKNLEMGDFYAKDSEIKSLKSNISELEKKWSLVNDQLARALMDNETLRRRSDALDAEV
jgi:hypothetical protein